MNKRLFDVLVAIGGLVFLFPLMIVIAAGIRVFSGPPILFLQARAGLGGKEFILWKFRTMAPSQNEDAFEPGDRARITPIGRILRKYKIDEWPQLINVLKGDMSIVGPRPEVAEWIAAYPERWKKVLRLRPGITDPASLVYRNEEELLSRAMDPKKTYREDILPHKLTLYEKYVQSHTMIDDLVIIARTVISVFKT